MRSSRARQAVQGVDASALSGALRTPFDACLRAALARSVWPRSVSSSQLLGALRSRLLAPGTDRGLWVAQVGRRIEGVMRLERLPFDSGIYGLCMARFEGVLAPEATSAQSRVASALLSPSLAACDRQGIDHVAVRAGSSDHGFAQALEGVGFRYMDTTVTLTWEARGRRVPGAREGVRPARPSDVRMLQRIAAEALLHGRVAHDPRLPAAKSRELYRRWIANACRGRSDTVLVYPARGGVVGFVCCNLDRQGGRGATTPVGFIDLLAVAPSVQRRGIGRSLLRAGLRWLASRSSMVEIRTQWSNGVSIALYQQEGFRVMSQGVALPSGQSFHRWFRSAR